MSSGTENITTIDSAQVIEAKEAQVPLVDVRPAAMYEAGHIPGAVNVPLVVSEDGSMIDDDDLVAAIENAGIRPTDDVVLYCQTGYHAGLAADMLSNEGFTNIELYEGSMNDWTAQNLPTER